MNLGRSGPCALDGNASQANKRTDLSNNRGANRTTVSYQYGLLSAAGSFRSSDRTGARENSKKITMLIEVSTIKSPTEVSAALHSAAQNHQFGVMHVHNLRETMAKKGVDFPRECLVFEVCQPQQAKKVLEEDMSISTALVT